MWWMVALGAMAVLVAAVMTLTVQTLPGTYPEARDYAERDAVQTAMDTMMADLGVASIAPNLVSVNDWRAHPTGTGTAPLGGDYLRDDTTIYFYCWDGTGKITRKDADAASCR